MWGKHDIGDKNLEAEINNSDSPEILKSLAEISRKNFGFFNKTLSRCVEYPYVVNKISESAGRHILDIGAGVSPLPLYFALHGATVISVDNSTTVRALGDCTLDWNGWGFLNYGLINKNVKSLNENICKVAFEAQTFDYVYSVSVIEHMSSQNRKHIWSSISPWIKNFGRLILTLDLIPKTESLWNYCEGKLVEQVQVHGDIKEVQREIEESGFQLEDAEILNMVSGSVTDIALLCFHKV